MWIAIILIGIALFYFISNSASESQYLKQNPFGENYKVLIDTLGGNLYPNEEFMFMQKDSRHFYIQKSKTLSTASHIEIVYRKNSIYLNYYQNMMEMVTTYSQTYNDTESMSSDMQINIAKDFVHNVKTKGRIKY